MYKSKIYYFNTTDTKWINQVYFVDVSHVQWCMEIFAWNGSAELSLKTSTKILTRVSLHIKCNKQLNLFKHFINNNNNTLEEDKKRILSTLNKILKENRIYKNKFPQLFAMKQWKQKRNQITANHPCSVRHS